MKGVLIVNWQSREAKTRFGAFLDASIGESPQLVTRHGVETAVLVPIDQWRRLRPPAKSNFKTLLLAPEPRTENLVPPRAPLRMRPDLTFD